MVEGTAQIVFRQVVPVPALTLASSLGSLLTSVCRAAPRYCLLVLSLRSDLKSHMSAGEAQGSRQSMRLPFGQGSGAFSICEPLALRQCLGCELPPTEPGSVHSYWEDWTWTTEMYPTSVLFSWPKARSTPLTQDEYCWLLHLIRSQYSIIDLHLMLWFSYI